MNGLNLTKEEMNNLIIEFIDWVEIDFCAFLDKYDLIDYDEEIKEQIRNYLTG